MSDTHSIALTLEKRLKSFDKDEARQKPTANDAFDLILDYDKAVGVYYGFKTKGVKSASFQRYHEVIVSVSHELLSFSPRLNEFTGYADWIKEYRSIWRRHIELFFFCLLLFVHNVGQPHGTVANQVSHGFLVIEVDWNTGHIQSNHCQMGALMGNALVGRVFQTAEDQQNGTVPVVILNSFDIAREAHRIFFKQGDFFFGVSLAEINQHFPVIQGDLESLA